MTPRFTSGAPIRKLTAQPSSKMYIPLTAGEKFAPSPGAIRVLMHFCNLLNKVEAKRVLAQDMVLNGIELYRSLPNKDFDGQVETLKWLLTTPPSVRAEEWLKVREKVDPRSQSLFRTHEPDLRVHLLGEKYTGPTGPVALTVRPRLEALERGPSAGTTG